MAQPVWVLSVDLQTKTATFQSGMSEAAKAAHGAFKDIQSGAGQMGRAVGENAMSARQSVMLLGDEFGVHLPRGLTMFIASLGPVGPAMEAAFPFVAIALGATLLIEHLATIRANGEKLTLDQVRFGTAVQTAFNSLDEKLLQAGIRTDELRNNHVGALAKQLKRIDMQSMDELVHSFGEVAKAADSVFADLKHSWYQFGSGSAGAKHSLEQFGAAYEALLAKGDKSGAADLLTNKLERETKILAMQQQAAATQSTGGSVTNGPTFNAQDALKFRAAENELKKVGVEFGKDDIKSQQALVDVLKAQVEIEGKISNLKKADSGNAQLSAAKTGAAQASSAAKAAAESQLRIAEQSLAAEKATADAKLEVTRASVKQREDAELKFAQRELDIQLQANHAEIAALDKMAADYPNALKALHEKAEELTAQHAAKVAEITSKAAVEQATKDLQDLEQTERAKIAATDEGSADRLSAIDAAIKREQALSLQDTSFYRDLLTQRVQTARQAAEQEAKETAGIAAAAAAEQQKMGELELAAAKQHQELLDSVRHVSEQRRVAEEIQAANQSYALKLTAASQDIAALDKSEKDYTVKLAQLQAKQRELIQEHENEVTAIKEKAEAQRNETILSAEQRAANQISSGLTQSIMGHQTWAHTVSSLASQATTGLIQNSLMIIAQQDKERLSNARTAATSAYKTGESIGGPAGIVLGPVFAAAAFAGVMAFQDGTDMVPGIGRGDKVPAMLEPGEGVVPGGVMDGLRNMARNGSMGGGHHYHVHTQIHLNASALDGDGMSTVLEKHGEQLEKHVQNAVRKMNH